MTRYFGGFVPPIGGLINQNRGPYIFWGLLFELQIVTYKNCTNGEWISHADFHNAGCSFGDFELWLQLRTRVDAEILLGGGICHVGHAQ